MYEPVGCVSCGGTGYLGRIGLYEVLVLTDEVRALILDKASSNEIEAVAVGDPLVAGTRLEPLCPRNGPSVDLGHRGSSLG